MCHSGEAEAPGWALPSPQPLSQMSPTQSHALSSPTVLPSLPREAGMGRKLLTPLRMTPKYSQPSLLGPQESSVLDL